MTPLIVAAAAPTARVNPVMSKLPPGSMWLMRAGVSEGITVTEAMPDYLRGARLSDRDGCEEFETFITRFEVILLHRDRAVSRDRVSRV